MADEFEERARVFFADGMPDATTIGEYERRLAALLREAAEERDEAMSAEIRASDMSAVELLSKADQTASMLRSTLSSVSKERDAYKRAKQENDERFMLERDQLRADLAAERERYAALRAKLARRVDLHDADGRALHTERERVERLRAVAVMAQPFRNDSRRGPAAGWLGEHSANLVAALDALHPGDLEPSDE